MIRTNRIRLETIWRKNGPDIQAILTGRMPRFLRTSDEKKLEGETPVFVFHSVQPDRFEAQLQYLADNNYKTIDADTLYKISSNQLCWEPRTVALTFDDASGSFWATAYPLLKKFGYTAILFVVPGLTPDNNQTYPNLENVWSGSTPLKEIEEREQIAPICTWSELQEMHQSGIVDIQSHSQTHSRINTSSKVVDFINPDFDSYFLGNVNIPIVSDTHIERPLRPIRLGQPVYISAPKLTGKRRFLENPDLADAMIRYVENNRGKDFFSTPSWRNMLLKQYFVFAEQTGDTGKYESKQDTVDAIRMEFSRSKTLLEEALPGKKIRHFCYPWFEGSIIADKTAKECCYDAVYYGLDLANPNRKEDNALPQRINRISDEYLLCLPGQGRQPVRSVWMRKLAFFYKRHKDVKKSLNTDI